MGKILIQRDESHPDKIAKLFYSKLPPTIGTPATPYVLLCDPMLATGGSALTAIEVLVGEKYKVAPENIIFANMICAPEGLKRMAEEYPQIKIVTAAIDECLNDDKFIVPGLGEYNAMYSVVFLDGLREKDASITSHYSINGVLIITFCLFHCCFAFPH